MSKTYITSEPDSFPLFFKKLWSFRALIIVFAVRDLKVKYSQTHLGIAWSVLQPLTALLIFTFFFEYVLEMSGSKLPYSIHVLSGLMGWNFFTYVFTAGAGSIQESSTLIRKIYFPKAILPLSKVVVAGVEMLISAVILIPLMLYFKTPLSINVVFLPVVWLFNITCGLTLVFWLGAFAIRKRDLYHLVPFLVYFGIWLTPVFYTADLIPESISFLFDYNPMANVLNLWRWSLFGIGELKIIYALNFFLVAVLFVSGMYVFSRREGQFSDFS
ncbi:MAG: ABC transporter permease [Flavobacteriales bacterium]|nr:ABC transporter permease [Flavobacteriales bacterium]